MKARIYHNPRCSKSRATLSLLEQRGVEIDVIDYLATPPDADEIRDLLARLRLTAADVVRTSESAFKESGLTLESTPEQLVALIERAPIVLQRPIVVVGNSARIGRPPERVLELLA